MNNEQERADFEAACRGHVDDAGYDEEALNLTRDGDGYIDKAIQAAWWGWREGRASLQSQDREDALEIAATLATVLHFIPGNEEPELYRDVERMCAEFSDHARRAEEDGE